MDEIEIPGVELTGLGEGGEPPKPPEPSSPPEGAPKTSAAVEAEAGAGAKSETEQTPPSVDDPWAARRKWYVIRVQTGREDHVKKAIERLKAARNLGGRIGEVIVPSEKRTEIKGGRRQVRQHKLFPGYVIVSMELSNDTWFAIRETPGVGDFLGLKDPIPLQDHEVEKLLKSIKAAEEKPKVKVSFQLGDMVRVKNGPFENFEGSVEDINERKGLVKVSFVIFGRPTNVDLEYWQLEKT